MNHARQKRNLNYQSLEARKMLAGDVTVVEDGHLFIRGDAADNQFEVVAVGDQLRVNGLQGTTINGQDSYLVAGATVTDAGVVFEGGLRAHLGPGSDDLMIQDAIFESSSVIFGGTGDDNIDVVDTDFMDRVVVQTYDGDDSISTTGSHFEGPLYIQTLDGQDSVSLTDSIFAGDSFVVTGNHSDDIESDGNHYLGDLNLLLPLNGDDTVQLNNPVLGENNLGVFLGNGDDSIGVDLTDASIEGTLRIGGQAGADQITEIEMNAEDADNVIVGTVEDLGTVENRIDGQGGTDQALEMPISDEANSSATVNVDNTLVYDNGAGGIDGVTGAFDRSFYNSPTDNYRYADDIQLSSTETFSQISWTGTYTATREGGLPFELDDFTIEFYEGNEVVPVGDPIASFNVGNDVNRSDTGVEIPILPTPPSPENATYPIFEYSADIDVTLEAGKTYWVSIFSATEDPAPEGVSSRNENNFSWASGAGEAGHESSFVYSFGQQGQTNPGWFNDFGPGVASYDFQLWSQS